jgi:hypothetical protein
MVACRLAVFVTKEGKKELQNICRTVWGFVLATRSKRIHNVAPG